MDLQCTMLLFLLLISLPLKTSCIPTERWIWGQKQVGIKKGVPENIHLKRAFTHVPQSAASPLHFNNANAEQQVTLFGPSNIEFIPVVESLETAPRLRDAGLTTKTRTTFDSLQFDGPVKLNGDDDSYTTLDRLFSERSRSPPLPRPETHQLGGLEPEEVFYADDDITIIKGGGFPSNNFKEPHQQLDDSPSDITLDTPFSKSSMSLPSLHEEYNGNIPAIVPPKQSQKLPTNELSLFLPATLMPVLLASPSFNIPNTATMNDIHRTTNIHVPHRPFFSLHTSPYAYQVMPLLTYRTTVNLPNHPQLHLEPYQLQTSHFHRPPTMPVRSHKRPLKVQKLQVNPVSITNMHEVAQQNMHSSHNGSPHQQFISLKGDTRVNYLHPKPPINPDAEIITDHHIRKKPML